MESEFLKRMNIFFSKNPSLMGEPATEEQILLAEKELNLKLNEEYIEFIKNFGGAYAGIAIHAFVNGRSIGNETVIELTNNARMFFNDSSIFPEINNCVVISDDGSGNPVAIEQNGEVVLFDFDTEEKQVLASSFSKFIEENFTEW